MSTVVAIQNGLTDVNTDQNVESISLMGNSGDYLFQQAGNQLKIFTSDNKLICTAPLQGDADGTRFVFANGSVFGKLSLGVMTLGGATVGSSAPGSVSPVTIDSNVENSLSNVLAGIISFEDPATANIFLDPGDIFTSGSVASVYGSSSIEKLRIQDGVVGIKVDQNLDSVIFAGSTGDYQYQQAGNQLKVFAGSTLVSTIPLQSDADGTQTVFSNGSVSCKLNLGVMSFGGTAVSSSAPGSLVPATINSSSTSANVIMSAGKSWDKMDIGLAYNDVTDIHLGGISSNLISTSDMNFGGSIDLTNDDALAGTSITLTGLSGDNALTGFI